MSPGRDAGGVCRLGLLLLAVVFAFPAFGWAAEEAVIRIDYDRGGSKLNPITGVNLSHSLPDIRRYLQEVGPGLFRVKWILNRVKDEDYAGLEEASRMIHAQGGEILLQVYGIPRELSSNPRDARIQSNNLEEYAKYPPSDYGRWRTAVKEVVQRLKTGGVKVDYYEIFGEPNIGSTWYGEGKEDTLPSFLRTYDETARAIREADPPAKIGGAGFALFRLPIGMPTQGPSHPMVEKTRNWIQGFLNHVKREKTPLDFFSIHVYDANARLFGEYATDLKRYLREEGFNVPLLVTEWNFSGRQRMDRRADEKYAASFVTAAMAEMLESGVDGQTFYTLTDGNLPFGLFKKGGEAKPSFQAMKLFAGLKGDSVNVTAGDEETYAMAARDGRNLSILSTWYISSDTVRYGGEKHIALRLENLPDAEYRVEIYRVSDDGITLERQLNHRGRVLSLDIPEKAYDTIFVRMNEAPVP